MADQLDSIFQKNENIMLENVLSRVTKRDVVIELFDKSVWPSGIGDSVDTLSIERSFADGASEAGDDWTQVVPDSLPADVVDTLPPEQTLTTGSVRRPTKLFWKALQSDKINLELIRGGFELGQVLDIQEQMYVTGVRRELIKRFIYAYLTTSSNLINASKANANDLTTVNPGSSGFPVGYLPDMELEQGFLDNIWDEVENETQGDGAVGNNGSTNANVYMLLTEPLTSRGLIANTAAIRQDINYATMGDGVANAPLLQPYGLDRARVYGNFIHKTFKEMPRFDHASGGGFVRRAFWKKVAASTLPGAQRAKGWAWIPNPDYASAQYTTSFIINTKVFKWLVPGMLNSPGGGTAFETPNYFPNGIKWLNERNLDRASDAYNPDKTIGRYRAVMAAAIQPLFPTYGWCILHKKHIPPYGSTYSGYSYGT